MAKRCLKCGYVPDNPNALFCKKCGTRLRDPEAEQEEHRARLRREHELAEARRRFEEEQVRQERELARIRLGEIVAAVGAQKKKEQARLDAERKRQHKEMLRVKNAERERRIKAERKRKEEKEQLRRERREMLANTSRKVLFWILYVPIVLFVLFSAVQIAICCSSIIATYYLIILAYGAIGCASYYLCVWLYRHMREKMGIERGK